MWWAMGSGVTRWRERENCHTGGFFGGKGWAWQVMVGMVSMGHDVGWGVMAGSTIASSGG